LPRAVVPVPRFAACRKAAELPFSIAGTSRCGSGGSALAKCPASAYKRSAGNVRTEARLRGCRVRTLFQGGAAIPWDRRAFLRIGGGLAVAGLAWPPLWPAGPAQAKPVGTTPPPSPGAPSCILVSLLGGPPHLDMWALKPAAPAEVRGPFRPIPTSLP